MTKRRSFFTGLGAAIASAFAAPAKTANLAPMGDLISDCREWGDDEDHPRRHIFVDGVEVHGVYYINFTRGFVRTCHMDYYNAPSIVRTRFYDRDTNLVYKYAQDGHCFIRRTGKDKDGVEWYGGWWDESPIPEGCEIVPLAESYCFLSRTIHGKIEIRPIQ